MSGPEFFLHLAEDCLHQTIILPRLPPHYIEDTPARMGGATRSAPGPITILTDERRGAGEHVWCSITRLDAVRDDGGQSK